MQSGLSLPVFILVVFILMFKICWHMRLGKILYFNKIQLPLILVLMLHSSFAFSLSTMRCGSNLVELGDDKFRVLEICGEPQSIQYRTKIVGSTLHHPRRTLDLEVYEEVQVEEWTYNFGRRRIRQSLLFENNILVEIKDLKRSW